MLKLKIPILKKIESTSKDTDSKSNYSIFLDIKVNDL